MIEHVQLIKILYIITHYKKKTTNIEFNPLEKWHILKIIWTNEHCSGKSLDLCNVKNLRHVSDILYIKIINVLKSIHFEVINVINMEEDKLSKYKIYASHFSIIKIVLTIQLCM